MGIIDKIKLALKLNSVIGTEIEEIKTMDIKKGLLTTEFWGKVATQAVTIWGAIAGFVPPKYAAIVVVVAEGIYTIARTALKIFQVIQTAKADQTTVTTTAPVTTVTTPA